MKQIYVAINEIAPIILAENSITIKQGISAEIKGPSKIIFNPSKQHHPKVWIEIEDNVEIEIKSNDV